MRDFLLDTQMIRYWYDDACPQHHAVIGNISLLRSATSALNTQPRLLISVVTLGEIEFGHRVQIGDYADENTARLRFINEQLPAPLEVTRDATEAYGELRMRLFNKFAPREKRKLKMRPEQLVDPTTASSLQIQENDLWICAQAVAHGMVLITNDRMKSIMQVASEMDQPLMVQNWTTPSIVAVDM